MLDTCALIHIQVGLENLQRHWNINLYTYVANKKLDLEKSLFEVLKERQGFSRFFLSLIVDR